MGIPLDIKAGDKFSRLTVIGRERGKYKFNNIRWECICDCGITVNVIGTSLRSGRTTSCGCRKREASRDFIKSRLTHGHSVINNGKSSKEHDAWQHIKDRCGNPYNAAYENYGGRGITVCDRWLDKNCGFLNFLSDVGFAPSPKHTLDRFPNNDGNYEPTNVRWATRKEQGRNKRNNIIIEYNGIKKCLPEWAELYNIPYGTLKYRVAIKKWDVHLAFTTPVRKLNLA